MEPALASEVWQRLKAGKTLEGLDLPTFEGRIDLRGFSLPAPGTAREFEFAGAKMRELEGVVVLNGIVWKDYDFSGAQLESLRFHGATLENCRFDAANCKDWRLWQCTVTDTSFRGADLKDTGLGGIENGQRNLFRRVDFSHADLRRSAHNSADMVGCIFSETKLRKVEFQGTVFVDCRFEGKLEEVVFCKHAFRGEHLPPNEMRGVDLRKAKLVMVEFRGLDMDDVRWPEGDDHIVIDDYQSALDRVLDTLSSRTDLPSRRLALAFGRDRKWAGPNQKKGVISVSDLVELGGPTAVEEFRRLIATH